MGREVQGRLLLPVDLRREHPTHSTRCCTNLEEELLPVVIPGDFVTWCKSFVLSPAAPQEVVPEDFEELRLSQSLRGI